MYVITDTNWKVRESAHYKLLTQGVTALSDAELLRTAAEVSLATARNLLDRYSTLMAISRMSVEELCAVKGVSKTVAMRIVATFELGRRKEKECHRPASFTDSEEVADYLRPGFQQESREVFRALYINRNNRIIADRVLFTGGISGTCVDIRLLIKDALNYHASAIIIAHNHPSGNLSPSTDDKRITRKIKRAASLIDIALIDHLIITDQGYFSFYERGVL